MILNETLDLSKVEINPSEEAVTVDRDKYLGGSDIAKLSDKRSIYNVFKQKQLNKSFKTKYTELGHVMEDKTKAYLKYTTGEDIQSASYVDEEKSVRVNMDGLIFTDNGREIAEMKNNTLNTSYQNIEHYIKQTHFYMYMMNTDKTRLFETERQVDENGNFITDIEDGMVQTSIIPRNEKIVEEIKTYIDDFKFLLAHKDISYNDFIGLDKELVSKWQVIINEFLPKYKKYKELEYEKKQLTNQIKALVDTNSNFVNGDIKISERTTKSKLDNLKIYRDYKQDFINYITFFEPEYRDVCTFRIDYNKVSYENFDDTESLLNRLHYVNEELDSLKEYVVDDEKGYKKELAELFPLGVDFEGLSFTVNKVRKSLDFEEFLNTIEINRNTVINRGQYLTPPTTSKVYKITTHATGNDYLVPSTLV